MGPELAVTFLALGLGFWRLTLNRNGNIFYAAAARSMNQSGHNFWFASYDPGGWVTVDKPPLALWANAISVHMFGMSSWALMGPSVVATGLSTWLLMRTIGRAWGRMAGIVAGLALATTPVMVAISRSNNPDAILLLCVVAAAACMVRAIERGHVGWVVAASALVGAGFLTKLLAALLVVPALWGAYLLCANTSWRRRVAHLVAGLAVVALVSGAWVAAVDHTPLDQRPWVGGSTNGSAANLVFGYDGVGRVTTSASTPAQQKSLATRQSSQLTVRDSATGKVRTITRVNRYGGTPGPFRLFNLSLGDQVMWLAPLAGGAAIAGTLGVYRRKYTPQQAGAVVLFALWTAATYVVFATASGIFHNYYVSLVAPGLAALVGIGAAMAARAARAGLKVAAGAVALTGGLHLVFMARIPALVWLRPVVAVAFVLATAALIVRARASKAVDTPIDGPVPRATTSVIAAVTVVALLAPLAWSIGGATHRASPSVPGARPSSTVDGLLPAGVKPLASASPASTMLGPSLLTWLRGQQATERWIVAVPNSGLADQAIIGGDSVMAMNGYAGRDPIMTPQRLARLLRAKELRFVLTGSSSTATKQISGVIAKACTLVPPARWGGKVRAADQQLGVGLYDCQGKAPALARSRVTLR